jgi:hypothetical protein
MPPLWRHYWPPCRLCCEVSVVAAHVITLLGLDGRSVMYTDPLIDCPVCEGVGYMPCEPQDLSTLRRWGVCATCGDSAFDLVNSTGADVEGSARHADPETEYDHEPTVTGGPLVSTIGDYIDRATA